MAAIMQGRVCLVTGATNGIGKMTALELARLGGTVIVAGRSREKAEQVTREIQTAAGHDRVTSLIADLSTLAGMRSLAEQFLSRFDRLDVLVNNAGGIFTQRQETSDGLEMTFALNHMSYFVVTHLLMEVLKLSAPARIVSVSSGAHFGSQIDFSDLQLKRGYSSFKAYSRSKLANVMFTYALSRRLVGTGITANTLHPGAVSTGFGSNNRDPISAMMFRLFRMVTMSPDKGAKTSIYLASSPEVNGVTGSYFDNSKAVPSSKVSYDEAAQEKLWQMSAEIAGLPVWA